MSMSAKQNGCGEGGDGISAATIAIRMVALVLTVALSGLIWFSPAARAAGGSVSGTVTDASTHAGLPGVAVSLYDTTGLVVATATSAADGTYTLSDAPAGPYEVGFTDAGYVPQFYSGKASLAVADPVAVTEGATTAGIDAALAASPGQISGSVTDASTHAGLPGVAVSLYDTTGLVVATATSAADGTYALGDVPAGAYEVGFAGAGYVPQFYSGKAALAVADPVSVAAGATTTGIDAALAASPGQISGSVTDASTHAGIQSVTVYAYDANGSLFSLTSTAANGTYALAGLPPGLYRLGFVSDGYLPQFYGGRSSLAVADPVAVTAGATTAGIDAALVTATGQISGRATDAENGKPIQKIEVTVYDAAGHPVNSACTGSDGTYTLSGLAPGSYRVGFNDNCGATDHVPQFYRGRASLASADPVTVAAGATTAGIDAGMQRNRPPVRPPKSAVVPGITGTPTLGMTLSATTGIWSGTPPFDHAYQWQRCNPSCVAIPGAVENSYTLRAPDLGARVRVVVAAVNPAGSDVADSIAIGKVAASLGQIRARLRTDIVPTGKDAEIRTLLRAGGYAYRCSALSLGRMVISWYRVQRGRRVARRRPPSVLVASGRQSVMTFGAARLRIRLTRRGKQLLRHVKRLKLTGRATFTPRGRPTVQAVTTFTLPPARPRPARARAEQFGANVNRLFNELAYTQTQIDAQLSALRSTGTTLARSDALWEFSEPAPPTSGVHRYDWRFDDAIAGSLAAQGVRWLPIIDYAPAWAASTSGQLHSPPARPSDYAAYAAALVARYGPAGAFWRAHPELKAEPTNTYEVWNEPDHPYFWPPAPDGRQYATLYLEARSAIKSVDPAARAIVGGLTGPDTFLPAMTAGRRRPSSFIDGVAIHPYGSDPPAVLARVRSARGTLTRLGMSTVPMYVTEFGWSTPPAGTPGSLPAAARPGYIVQTLSALGHLDCGVAAALIYTWITPQHAPADIEDWYGIHPPDGTPSADTLAFTTGLRNATRPAPQIHLCAGVR